MKSRGIRIIILTGLLAGTLTAQMAGNPVDTRGKGEWTVGLSGSYSSLVLPTRISTTQFLLKSEWGLSPWLDLYVTGGVARLEMEYADFADYKDQYRPAYGLGFTLSTPEDHMRPAIGFWAGAHLLRFESEGSISKVSLYMTEEHDLEYDSREFEFYAGIKMPFHRVRFYAAGVGYILNRDEKMKVYMVQEDDKTLLKKASGGYRSDVQTGALAGLQFDLPKRYSVCIEGLFFNETDYKIMIGICQTGLQ